MPDPVRYGLDNPHPLSQMRTELVWEGKYDEYGARRTVDVAGCAMPLQRIETIDEPAARLRGQGNLFDAQKAHRDDFRDMLIWGDNKLVMASLLRDFKGRIDLIYIDPPFDVGADFTMNVPLGDEKETIGKDQSALEMVAYRDMWGKGTDSYLYIVYERLTLMKELLSETGSIYVHVGPNSSHYMKALLDEVFGPNNYLNDLVWQRFSFHADAKRFGIVHDSILFYAKGENWTWNVQRVPLKESYIASHCRRLLLRFGDDLDRTLIDAYIEQVKKIRPGSQIERMSHEEVLRSIYAVAEHEGKWYPTPTGLLFFCREPQRYLPQSPVEFLHLWGPELTSLGPDGSRWRLNQEISGTLPKIIDEVEALLLGRIATRGIINGFRRHDEPEYPRFVLRESVVNAVAHRDYTLRGSRIQVRLFPDRIEVHTPGGLPPPVTVDNIEDEQATRNKVCWPCRARAAGLITSCLRHYLNHRPTCSVRLRQTKNGFWY